MISVSVVGAGSDIDCLYAVYPGGNRIFVGSGCFKELETRLFDTRRDNALKKVLEYTNLTDFVIDNVENALTHETIHVLLYRICGGTYDAFFRLDKIDRNYEISGVRCEQRKDLTVSSEFVHNSEKDDMENT